MSSLHDLLEVIRRHVDIAGAGHAHAIGVSELIPGQLQPAPWADGCGLEAILDPLCAAAATHLYVALVSHGLVSAYGSIASRIIFDAAAASTKSQIVDTLITTS